MKRSIGSLIMLIALALPAWAVYLENVPTTLTQPDGKTVPCLIDGDEFFHRVHDAAGYTIIKDAASGWYVYAVRQGEELGPTSLIAGQDDPSRLGLEKGIMPAPSTLRELRNGLPRMAGKGIKSPTAGTINNIVIFIRFADQDEFTDSLALYSRAFNDSAAGANSMRNYFYDASYQQLTIRTSEYPLADSGIVTSYQDTHDRNYFMPYDASGNPAGYTGGDNGTMRFQREQTLLQEAVAAVSPQIPADLNVDGDGDGVVDNVCFIIEGGPTAWATLLWPHMWELYYSSSINGKQVGTYNFQIQSMFQSSVLCHEMGHSLGYPNLYHYYNGTNLSPCGVWDVMCSTPNPPTHTGAYMKYQYTHWISDIPEITATGTYWLKPLASGPSGVCYRIASPSSASEYFVVEYRRKTGTFEISAPGSGLLVYRINGDFAGQGNAMYDGSSAFDEVYIYRPGGTPTVNGSTGIAYFSAASGRTAINSGTNPSSFLHDGTAGGLNISSVGAAGDSISFYVTLPLGVAAAPAPTGPGAKLRLSPARPNPSNGITRVSFELGAAGPARLGVYSVTGQLVTELTDGLMAAGRHEAMWSGRDRSGKQVASGVYYVRLESNGRHLTQRLTILR